MILHGVCLDVTNPAGCPDPKYLAYLGLNGGRVEALNGDPRFYSYCVQLASAGMGIAVLLGPSTFKSTTDYRRESAEIAAALKSFGVKPLVYVVGNEEDAWMLNADSPSSWTAPLRMKMRMDTYALFFTECVMGITSVDPNADVILGGFVAGQPTALRDYLIAIRRLYSGRIKGYDLHPYNKTVDEIEALFNEYDRYIEPEMWGYCLEWNRPVDEIGETMAYLSETNWAWAMWSDGMVPPMGAVDEGQNVKPEGRALSRWLP